ncbi:hypothetical protein EVAR_58009_1 [Eumeta japonica]|uniref:Uncharacterized protein n=1 Tax=Eumeta variegata TaxID=151549 RepID=A0A4C1YA42_EUMVA|nr:hypothetical protein EVAR_58009_1 [Eumeta japonica]
MGNSLGASKMSQSIPKTMSDHNRGETNSARRPRRAGAAVGDKRGREMQHNAALCATGNRMFTRADAARPGASAHRPPDDC